MKITGYGSIQNASTVKKRGEVSPGGNFADLLATSETEESAAVSATGDVAATAALSNLLALQEIPEEEVRRRKLVQQGKGMVDALERLRQQLLIGTLPRHVLLDLSRQLALHRQKSADPELNALIDDIELRAAVELAKLEMALKPGETEVP